jgi:hypothetical protein
MRRRTLACMDASQPDGPVTSLAWQNEPGLAAGGTEGNELLTSQTGALLFVLLAVIGVTILRLGQLLSVHLFVGALLIGPLALKLASTGYRFVRYYTHDASYWAKGAPPTPLRLIAPLVVLSTLAVMASGVVLLFEGPQSRSTWLPIHKVSFIAWGVFMTLHVIGHLASLPRAIAEDYGHSDALDLAVPGRNGRALSLAGALVLGVVVAILLIPEFGPWLNAHLHHH